MAFGIFWGFLSALTVGFAVWAVVHVSEREMTGLAATTARLFGRLDRDGCG